MDRWDGFRHPARDSGSDPVYSTPNHPPSSSSPSSPLPVPLSSLRSPSSSTAKSVSFADSPSTSLANTPRSTSLNNILDNLDPNHLANLLAVVGKTLPSDPIGITQRLSELQRQEDELELQSHEIESKKKEVHIQRSQLIKQLEKVLSTQSNVSSNAVKSPHQLSPLVKPTETTIIEQLPDFDPPSQPRSPNSSTFKKRPGPASKTGLKAINPGSLPPLGPVAGSSKKPQKEGDDASKRPVTTGVKQSRPQPMRARKRNKDNESEPSTIPQSSIPQSISDKDQATGKSSQSQPQTPQKTPPPPPSPRSPQPPKQLQAPSSKPDTPRKSQSLGNPVPSKSIKTEPKTDEKSRLSLNSQNNDLPNPSPFRERSGTGGSSSNEPIKKKIKQEPEAKSKKQEAAVVISKDDADPLRPQSVQGGSDDDGNHSDSDIFNVMSQCQANGESPDINIRKVKKEKEITTPATANVLGTTVSVKCVPQEASKRELKIKQEK